MPGRRRIDGTRTASPVSAIAITSGCASRSRSGTASDPILKERLFGLTGNEGNHAEDVKEYYYYLDATPTYSYAKCLYKYPQAAYPYHDLVTENRRRGKFDWEYELIDTGVFDGNRYFDIFVEYAKAIPYDDLLVRDHGRSAIAARRRNNADVISMPDKWEYPWYAAWDLAFHCVPLALVDPEFAKEQLVLLTARVVHAPERPAPAYEWAFGDVNPPVHAWAAGASTRSRSAHAAPATATSSSASSTSCC
jgi:hypothetical protein